MMTSNSHAQWAGTRYEEAELSGRNCVRSSSDLNHLAATLPHAKTSWQSLKLQVTMATDDVYTVLLWKRNYSRLIS